MTIQNSHLSIKIDGLDSKSPGGEKLSFLVSGGKSLRIVDLKAIETIPELTVQLEKGKKGSEVSNHSSSYWDGS